MQPTETGDYAVQHFIDLADDDAQGPAGWARGEFLDLLQQLAVGLLRPLPDVGHSRAQQALLPQKRSQCLGSLLVVSRLWGKNIGASAAKIVCRETEVIVGTQAQQTLSLRSSPPRSRAAAATG